MGRVHFDRTLGGAHSCRLSGGALPRQPLHAAKRIWEICCRSFRILVERRRSYAFQPSWQSIRTFASTATSGLDGTSIVELEEFVAQLLAPGVTELVAPGAVLGASHGTRRGFLDLLFLRFHVRHAATGLRGVNSTDAIRSLPRHRSRRFDLCRKALSGVEGHPTQSSPWIRSAHG